MVFNYINVGFGDFAGTPMSSRLIHSDYVDSGHDLRIQIHDVGDSGQYGVHLDCNLATFEPALRERMPGHFLRMLDAPVGDIDSEIAKFSLVSPPEQQLFEADLKPVGSPQQPESVLQAWSERVAIAPQQTAVRCADSVLSRGETG